MNAKPLSQRFLLPDDDSILRARISFEPNPLTKLSLLSPVDAANLLGTTLSHVVVPTTQIVTVIRQLADTAKSYCDRAYADKQAILKLIYGSTPPIFPEDAKLICLTGLSGVGKSVILDAFSRAFSGEECFAISKHTEIKAKACWRMRIRGRASFADLIIPQFRQQEGVRSYALAEQSSSEAASQGIGLILPDEFQFITSSKANSLMVKMLFMLGQIGPPVVYACNFSMVRALLRRPQQDRQRLLVDPIIVLPESLGQDWERTVEACLKVAPEFRSLDRAIVQRELHDYTYGIKRALRTLLVLSYLEMRREKHRVVTRQHIANAYRSTGYWAMRDDVENLFLAANSPDLLPKDLRPPITASRMPPTDNAGAASTAPAGSSDETAQASLLSMLSPDGKRALEAIAKQSEIAPPAGKPPRRRPATAAALVQGADRYSRTRRR